MAKPQRDVLNSPAYGQPGYHLAQGLPELAPEDEMILPRETALQRLMEQARNRRQAFRSLDEKIGKAIMALPPKQRVQALKKLQQTKTTGFEDLFHPYMKAEEDSILQRQEFDRRKTRDMLRQELDLKLKRGEIPAPDPYEEPPKIT